MSKIVVVENLSLDGVMQAPGRADEDLRGGFQHGGWALPYNDSVKGQIMAWFWARAAVSSPTMAHSPRSGSSTRRRRPRVW